MTNENQRSYKMALSQQERKELIRFIRSNQLNIKSSTGWTNYSKFRQNKEALVLDIDDTESLSKVLQFITALNKRKDPAERTLVRPAAGGRGKSTANPIRYMEWKTLIL